MPLTHAPLGLHLVLDCRNPEVMAMFWSRALGYSVGNAGEPFTTLHPPSGSGPELVLQRVIESKQGKNRMHLDLRVSSLEPEVARLVRLGAKQIARYDEPGWRWCVMTDPEDNEFCVLEPAASPN